MAKLNKKELQALADANSVEYTDKTTNAELEDLLEAKGVKLDSADDASDSEGVQLTGSPASPSGTAIDTDGDGDPEPAETGEPEASSGSEGVDGEPPEDMSDIDTEELVRARDIIDRVLAARSDGDTAPPAQTAIQQAKDLPIFDAHELTLKQAAGKLDIDENRVLGFHVRQATDQHGNPFGEAWVVATDVDGVKHAKKL